MMKKPVVKTEKDLSRASMLNKAKALFSPTSAAGMLRDRELKISERFKKLGE